MPFDFKKEYREFYLPKAKPEIVTVPRANYIAVRGEGDPNEENGAYQRAIGVLYAVAYTLKMSKRAGHEIDGFFDYVVPPLEGFWKQAGTNGAFDLSRKDEFERIFAGSLSCACRISSRKRTSTGRSRRRQRRKSSTVRKRNFWPSTRGSACRSCTLARSTMNRNPLQRWTHFCAKTGMKTT